MKKHENSNSMLNTDLVNKIKHNALLLAEVHADENELNGPRREVINLN